jgi:phenylacetate-CoA ligase
MIFKSESIYRKSPVWLQNLAISWYGYKIENSRHHGEYRKYFSRAISQAAYDTNTLHTHIITKLKATIRRAEVDVPHYRELFRKQGITSTDISTLEDLRQFPTLSKDIIRKNPESLISERYEKRNLIVVHTTGTTGTPLQVFCDAKSRQQNYAYYDRFLKQAGFDYKGKRATLGGRIVVPAEQKKPPFWRYSRYQKNLLLSSYHLTEGNVEAYANILNNYRPD